ncbi:MAG: polysaccharide biosynthesis tyrosine autokinase [candidate division KSB1 bacterium]|nr:polysaccharide biosynthesis tyrosine autokinase [candidate division KSB1 bacterium]MDZ7301507.1 polysaccharide biosynthesis tyrosine autokinase [candidate division KSB1 bacterium]MDZ7310909.1 polysaccharide biosynthesis tyrosine autokinase [candidate division KSB1 bacterium]
MEELQERHVSFKDYFRIFYRGRWIITTTFLLVMAITVYVTFTATPEYEATAKLMIEDKGVEQTIFDIGSFMKKETMINNQVEILKSRTLAETVVKRLQASELANKLVLLNPHEDRSVGLLADVGHWVRDLVGLRSDTVEQHTIEDIIEDFQSQLAITPIRDTDMIEIRVTGASPEEATFIANTLATAYSEKNRLESQEEVRQVKNFLDEQLRIVQNQLTESEEALKNFQENEKVVALPHETEELIKNVAEFEGLYNAALTEYNSNRERLKYINEQLDRSKKNFDLNNISVTPYFEGLKRQIGELEGKRTSYIASLINAGVYRDDDPQVRKYEEQINLLKKQLQEEIAKLAAVEVLDPVALSENLVARKIEIEANLQALQPKVEALKRIVHDYDKQMESLPEKSLKLARLERAARADEKIYLMMQEKYQESRITEVGQLGQVRIIDPARPPKQPVRPRKKLNLFLGFIVGLGLGIGLTFLLEYMDNSVRTIEDVEKLGIPVLGSIPMIKEQEAIKRIKILPSAMNGKNGILDNPETRRLVSRLITHFAPKSPISEAYRTFRTNIQYTKLDRELKALLVTSPGPGEGKSTSVANLAITVAQMGSKVLLIDSDLRRPVLHSIFNIDRRVGLSNVLVGRATIDEAVQNTEIENLYLMPCGTLPPNPSELLGSTAMHNALEEMKQKFDIILFDSPPIIAVTDAAVLSSQLDGVIIVIKSGQTDREAAFRAHTLLTNVKTRVLGALLNGVRVESMYGSYYYYYHYYYYGKDGERKRKTKKRARAY